MKRVFIILFSILFSSWGGFVWASQPIPPPPHRYVLDEVGVLSLSTTESLNRLFAQHERATGGEQVVFALFKSLGDEDLVLRTNQIFKSWGIGQKGKDNGVLLALYWKEHQIRLEVGYGLEPLLTDAISKRILSEKVVPALKRDQPGEALKLAAIDILTVLKSPVLQSSEAKEVGRTLVPSRQAGTVSPVIVFLLFGALIFLFWWLNRLRPRSRFGYSRYNDFSSGGFGGGSSSIDSVDNDSFKGGGGSSGGGGANDSW